MIFVCSRREKTTRDPITRFLTTSDSGAFTIYVHRRVVIGYRVTPSLAASRASSSTVADDGHFSGSWGRPCPRIVLFSPFSCLALPCLSASFFSFIYQPVRSFLFEEQIYPKPGSGKDDQTKVASFSTTGTSAPAGRQSSSTFNRLDLPSAKSPVLENA